MATNQNDLFSRWFVGVLTAILTFVFLFLLGWVLIANPLTARTEKLADPTVVQVTEAIVIMLAGGIGSSVTTIRAYLKHACELRDFQREYIPWYPFRQITGALMSLIFYFTLKGGILFFTIAEDSVKLDTLNIWAIAAVGGLVGLFSQYALERLRKVFIATFAVEDAENKTQS